MLMNNAFKWDALTVELRRLTWLSEGYDKPDVLTTLSYKSKYEKVGVLPIRIV